MRCATGAGEGAPRRRARRERARVGGRGGRRGSGSERARPPRRRRWGTVLLLFFYVYDFGSVGPCVAWWWRPRMAVPGVGCSGAVSPTPPERRQARQSAWVCGPGQRRDPRISAVQSWWARHDQPFSEKRFGENGWSHTPTLGFSLQCGKQHRHGARRLCSDGVGGGRGRVMQGCPLVANRDGVADMTMASRLLPHDHNAADADTGRGGAVACCR